MAPLAQAKRMATRWTWPMGRMWRSPRGVSSAPSTRRT